MIHLPEFFPCSVGNKISRPAVRYLMSNNLWESQEVELLQSSYHTYIYHCVNQKMISIYKKNISLGPRPFVL